MKNVKERNAQDTHGQFIIAFNPFGETCKIYGKMLLKIYGKRASGAVCCPLTFYLDVIRFKRSELNVSLYGILAFRFWPSYVAEAL